MEMGRFHGERKDQIVPEAEKKQLAFSSSKALFYEYNHLGGSCHGEVKGPIQEARAPGEQGSKWQDQEGNQAS